MKINTYYALVALFLQHVVQARQQKLNEFHLADVDAELDKALQTEGDQDVKDNYAYREVLKTMLLNNDQTEVQQDNEELNNLPGEKSDILDQQLKKLLGFLNRNVSRAQSYLSKNQKSGKSGLSWVYKDIIQYIRNYDSSNQETQNITKIARLLMQYPDVILHHDFLDKHDQFFESEQNVSNFRKKREKDLIQYYSDRDYQYVIDETEDIKNSLSQILKDLPENIENEKFKEYTDMFLDAIQKSIQQNKKVLNNEGIPNFEKDIQKLKKFLSSLKVLNQDEIKDILYVMHYYVEKNLKLAASPEGYQVFQDSLKDLSSKIQQEKQDFSSNYPMRKPLQKDLDEFVNTISNKILQTDQFQHLNQVQMIKLEKLLNDQLDKEFKGIDKKRFYNDIQKFSKNLNTILSQQLKESLSEQNLQNIVQGVAESALQDIDSLRDENSQTGLKISPQKIQDFANKVIQKIKSMHEKNGKIRFTIPLKQTDILVQELTSIIQKYYKPENLQSLKTPEEIAQKIIASESFLNQFEDEIYTVINKQSLKDEYYKFAQEFLKKQDRTELQFQNELDNSQLYNYVQSLTHKDQQQNEPTRLLTTLAISQNKNIRQLSTQDSLSLKYLRNLCLRWNKNYHKNVNYSKIFNRELRKLAKIVYIYGLDVNK